MTKCAITSLVKYRSIALNLSPASSTSRNKIQERCMELKVFDSDAISGKIYRNLWTISCMVHRPTDCDHAIL